MPDAAPVTQLDVRATMAHLGGYWPASAGVLRLLEELGEVAELLDQDNPSGLDEELADVWIISTVVADQFLAAVEPLTASVAAPAGAPTFASLVAAAGQIARVVNYYDGPKAPRTRAGWTGMKPAIDTFHSTLHAFAAAGAVDLRAEVAGKLAQSRAIDAGRFARTFDPSTAPVLDRVRAARPDLAAARLFGAPDWADGPFELGVAALRSTALTFTKAAGPERLDRLVVPLPASVGGRDRVLLELRRALVGHADGQADALGDVLADELVVEFVELGDDRAVLVRHEELHRLGGL